MESVVAPEQERRLLAERLLSEIERRHGLPHADHSEIHPYMIDRFLVAYLPEYRDGEPAPDLLEFAFTPTIAEAVELLGRVVEESPSGYGSACYIHDLGVAEMAEAELS